MTLTRILIASPIRYRPECPEVLPAFLEALAALDWQWDRREFWFFVHGRRHGDSGTACTEAALARFFEKHEEDVIGDWMIYDINATEDSRLISGPRHDGETQENLAFLRNKILRHFAYSEAEYLLMVDSDVILHPAALRRMLKVMMNDARQGLGPSTVTLQINNTPWEGGDPQGNGSWLDGGRMVKVPWAEDGSVISIHRAGACTLYPREVLHYRFHWSPRYSEENESLFDETHEDGWEHWYIRDPSLADHRMKRAPSVYDALQEVLKAKGRG